MSSLPKITSSLPKDSNIKLFLDTIIDILEDESVDLKFRMRFVESILDEILKKDTL